MNKKSISIAVGAFIVIIVAIIFGVKTTNDGHHANAPVRQNTNTSVTKSSKKEDKSTKTNEHMTRESAVQASQQLLRAVNSNKQSIKSRLMMLSKAGNNPNAYNKALSKDARDKIRLVDFMDTDNRGRILTAQAVLEVAQGIVNDGNKSITATHAKDYNTIVYFDKAMKTAVVPVDLYTNVPTNLNMTFEYIDGQWKFDPYNLISEISVRQADNTNAKFSRGANQKTTQEQIQKALQQAVQQSKK